MAQKTEWKLVFVLETQSHSQIRYRRPILENNLKMDDKRQRVSRVNKDSREDVLAVKQSLPRVSLHFCGLCPKSQKSLGTRLVPLSGGTVLAKRVAASRKEIIG